MAKRKTAVPFNGTAEQEKKLRELIDTYIRVFPVLSCLCFSRLRRIYGISRSRLRQSSQ